MRALPTMLVCLTAPVALGACHGDRPAPTGPTAAPAAVVSLGRSAAIDPSHTYRFSFTCSAAAATSEVTVYAAGPITLACNSSTDRGPAYGTAFLTFGYETVLRPAERVCAADEIALTGAYRCRARKYTGVLTVTDLGVVAP